MFFCCWVRRNFNRILFYQEELDNSTEEWNNHRIRRCRNSVSPVSPSGRPDVMYNFPTLYCGRNFLNPLHQEHTDRCSEQCVFVTKSCSDETILHLFNMYNKWRKTTSRCKKFLPSNKQLLWDPKRNNKSVRIVGAVSFCILNRLNCILACTWPDISYQYYSCHCLSNIVISLNSTVGEKILSGGNGVTGAVRKRYSPLLLLLIILGCLISRIQETIFLWCHSNLYSTFSCNWPNSQLC